MSEESGNGMSTSARSAALIFALCWISVLPACVAKHADNKPLGSALSFLKSKDVGIVGIDGVKINPKNEGVLIAPGLRTIHAVDERQGAPHTVRRFLFNARAGTVYVIAPNFENNLICAWVAKNETNVPDLNQLVTCTDR